MRVLRLLSWENVKCVEGLKEYYEYIGKFAPYLANRRKMYNVKATSWGDGTGKMLMIEEFDSFDALAKYEDDEEYQKGIINFCRLVNNAKTWVLRESISVPP